MLIRTSCAYGRECGCPFFDNRHVRTCARLSKTATVHTAVLGPRFQNNVHFGIM